eukprot:1332147-Alexandrium_andersonii.AAC.1
MGPPLRLRPQEPLGRRLLRRPGALLGLDVLIAPEQLALVVILDVDGLALGFATPPTGRERLAILRLERELDLLLEVILLHGLLL